MKNYTYFLSALLLLRCSSLIQEESDQVVKTVTTIEYEIKSLAGKQEKQVRQKQITKYNSQHKKVEELDYYGHNLDFGGGLVYKYDQKGRVIEADLLDIGGDIPSKSIYAYRGNMADVTQFRAAGSPIKKGLYAFDEQGNPIITTEFYQDGQTMLVDSMKYDSKGNLAESFVTLDGKPNPRHMYKYDKRGNLMEQYSVNAQGEILNQESFSYESFDEKGNWTVRKSNLQGKLHTIAERVTEYK